MPNTYFTLITQTGLNKLAEAVANSTTMQLNEFAVGDGGGAYYVPTVNQTDIIDTPGQYRAALNRVYIDDTNADWLIMEAVVPTDVGGFTIREIGIYDTDGDLFAIANYPETYKPDTNEGVARDLLIRTIVETSNADTVDITVDLSTVLAARDEVLLKTDNLDGIADIQVAVGNLLPGGVDQQLLTKQSNVAGDATWQTLTSLPDVTSIQNQTVSLAGALTVEADSIINQDLSSDATVTFTEVNVTNQITGNNIISTEQLTTNSVTLDKIADATVTPAPSKIVVANGNGYIDVEWLRNIFFERWIDTLTSMPTQRRLVAATVLDGLLYAIGGYHNGALATVEVYNIANNSWETKASISGRYRLAAVAVNNEIYAIGGVDNSNPELTTVQSYDPSNNTWSPKASMDTPRAGPAAAVVDGLIYAIGGTANTDAALEVYNPNNNDAGWEIKSSVGFTKRTDLMAAVVDGMIYAIGGREDAMIYNTVQVYDPNNDGAGWVTKQPMPTPRYGLAGGVIDGKIYAIGGINDTGSLDVVEVYDPNNESAGWESRAAMPMTRYGLGSGVIDNKIYLIGGADSNSGSSWLNNLQAYLPFGF